MSIERSINRVGRGKINLFLDITLALAFVLSLEEHFTGLNLHELIGVGLGIGIIVHLILHWRWVLSVTWTFFRKLLHESRLSYLLNLVLFVDLLVIIVTGIAISRTLGLSLGLEQDLFRSFEQLHKIASNFSLLLVGVHVGLHWKWILTQVRRLFPRRLLHRQVAAPALSTGGQS